MVSSRDPSNQGIKKRSLCGWNSLGFFRIVSKQIPEYDVHLVDDHCDVWTVFVLWLFWRRGTGRSGTAEVAFCVALGI